MIAALISGVAYAQGFAPNIVGNWQGTLLQGKGLRLVLQVAKVDTGDGQGRDLSSSFLSIDTR
ncbi:MAG: hypothetical protein DMF73_03295 [Acidobacteria bacterium]|nr:MAG: hypothetical protein DMF73_03295 [Acidobacteriota bacterium]